jgi:ABC-type antimicrobial peptide transport system permease subunit
LPDWLGVPSISGTVVFTVILILGTLGLLSGYFPARRAAKMDPVVALMR